MKLRRDGVCNRSLPVYPEVLSDSQYAALCPCVQLLYDAGDDGIVQDPRGFCELLLMTRETGPSRMGEQAFRESSADDVEEMVLVRDLKPASGGYSAAFIR